MSHDKKPEFVYLVAVKDVTCRAECVHKDKEKPRCTHEWIELDHPGRCIFFKPLAASKEG